jgi:hypothetical protein
MSSYEEAKKVAREHGIETQKEFRKWDRPRNMPSNPDGFYKTEWTSWPEFLGTQPKQPKQPTSAGNRRKK